MRILTVLLNKLKGHCHRVMKLSKSIAKLKLQFYLKLNNQGIHL